MQVFVLGVEQIGEVSEIVQKEFEKYDDLIVLNMIDSYSNMTIKSLNILRWIIRYCRAPRFILQVQIQGARSKLASIVHPRISFTIPDAITTDKM